MERSAAATVGMYKKKHRHRWLEGAHKHKTVTTRFGHIDEGMFPLVELLNDAGIVTRWSCEGGPSHLVCRCGRERGEKVQAYIAFVSLEQLDWLVRLMGTSWVLRPVCESGTFELSWNDLIPELGLSAQICWRFPSEKLEEYTIALRELLSNERCPIHTIVPAHDETWSRGASDVWACDD